MKLIYAGRINNHEKSLQHLYFEENTSKRLVFDKKLGGPMTVIGSIIECEDKGGGVYGSFQLTEGITDSEFIHEHSVRDKAVYEAHRAQNLNSKVSKALYENTVKDLKQMTANLSRAEKKAFITKIVLEIL